MSGVWWCVVVSGGGWWFVMGEGGKCVKVEVCEGGSV